MSDNKNLHKAKNQKNDEFYTQLKDVENELCHYEDHFKGKTVYCNTDDPKYSNFWRYFHENFEYLGLKGLIATCYQMDGSSSFMVEYSGGNDKDISIGTKTQLNGDGDFRSSECIDILKRSDVVITNPPFSLFRPFISQLMEYGKKFLVIGNMNAITYKEIFPLIKENRIWLGCTKPKEFLTPDGDIKKFGNILWFTNLDHRKRHEPLELTQSYWDNPDKYPHYDNYDAIEVSKVKDIPFDYFECEGVPITFLDKYSPEQFEILGATESEGKGFSNGLWKPESKVAQSVVDKKRIYKRLFIKKKDSDDEIYESGVMGVPLTFLDKYDPEQFEILDMTNQNSKYKTKEYIHTSGHDFNRSATLVEDGEYRSLYDRILIKKKM